MSESKNVFEGWEKWQIALAVGSPIALGLAGLWFYNRSKRGSDSGRIEKGNAADDIITKDATDGTSAQPSSSTTGNAEEEKTPFEKAQDAKNKGNKYFKGGKYENAISCYTEAISLCPDNKRSELATFYQNRAAAYDQLKQNDDVINDCTKALEYNSKYVKALFRRAKACEAQGQLMQSLEDVTATCLLEGFSNQQSILMADRVLKALGTKHAKEAYQSRQPITPSKQFIRTYFTAFANDPILAQCTESEDQVPKSQQEDAEEEIIVDSPPEAEREENQQENQNKDQSPNSPVKEAIPEPSAFQRAQKQLLDKQYDGIIELCNEELLSEDSQDYERALLLKATFHTLRGEGERAMTDLTSLLSRSNVDNRVRSNALIKRGSLKMQNGDQVGALDDFAAAVREDRNNSDVYHHRGQLHLLINRTDEAVDDFKRSVALSPNFAIGHVQKCYTEYRLGLERQNMNLVQESMRRFEELIERFPHCAEGYVLYGQSLAEQRRLDEAEKYFIKGLEIEPDNSNIYVQRGLLKLSTNEPDIDGAAELISKAIEQDDKCEYAYETMGTIEVNRGQLDRAVEFFNKAIALAKTEVEMSHLFSLRDGAIAQSQVVKSLGIQFPNLMGAS